MISHLYLFLGSILYVAFRAFQQRNVMSDNYLLILPTSIGMSAVDIYLISQIAKSGWGVWNVLAMGTGGAIGCLLAMLIHKHFVLRKKS